MSGKKSWMKWGGGQLFCFSALDGKTDFANGLVLRSAEGCFGLEIRLPEAAGRIVFGPEMPDRIDFAGDYIETPQLHAAFPDAHHFLIEGNCIAEITGTKVKSFVKGNRILIGTEEFFREELFCSDLSSLIAARKRWLDSLPVSDPVLRKACSQLKTQLLSPEGKIRHLWSTPDRFPHRGMWIWDSAFHAIGLDLIDPGAAKEILLAVFDSQEENGFVPHMASPERHSGITQPPVLGYAAEKLLETADDPVFLAEFYRKNSAFLKWIMANRDSDGKGLVEWFIEGDSNCRCGESGMDNSVRFDDAVLLDSPDFNAFLSKDCQVMAKFASRLGLQEESFRWQQQSGRLNKLMNQLLWNAEYGLYFDRNVKENTLSRVASSAGFLPLLCGAPAAEQAEAMVKNLLDPVRFATAVPVPSVSRDHPAFSTDMWRGPMWANINLMIAEGLASYGFTRESRNLSEKTEETLRKYAEKYGTFFEYYDADDALEPQKLMRKGSCSDDILHQPLRDYGWSAALFIFLKLKNSASQAGR